MASDIAKAEGGANENVRLLVALMGCRVCRGQSGDFSSAAKTPGDWAIGVRSGASKRELSRISFIMENPGPAGSRKGRGEHEQSVCSRH